MTSSAQQHTSPRPVLVPAALAATAALSVVSVALQPDLPADHAARLAALHADAVPAAISAVTFLVAQAPMLLAVVGIAALARPGAPRLSRLGAALGWSGAFGHAVFGGLSRGVLLMAADPSRRAAYAHLYARVESSPVMLFALVGLAGTVLGLLLLGVALFRSRVVPRWVPVLVWVFLVLEFAGSGVSRYASYAGSLCLAAAFLSLAVFMRAAPPAAPDRARTPRRRPAPGRAARA
jgi:hypothetical protein